MITEIHVGDILEGSNCTITKHKIDFFRVVKVHINYGFTITATRMSDNESCDLIIGKTYANWRVIKHNNRTVCLGCKRK